VTVAFNKNSGNLGVLGEIIGVHHQKMAIFDDRIIIGGANMSQSYFLNRKDRYLEFN
jgi:phosphatidylserine/phosphatidylglycerophosphate/cardiolipin synthase-like enzyme